MPFSSCSNNALTIDLHGNRVTNAAEAAINLHFAHQLPHADRKIQRTQQSQLARQLLRDQLASLYDCVYTSEQLPLASTPLGKPFLTNPAVEISLSHSHGWAASGIVANTAPILMLGVDIEAIRARDWINFLDEVFTPAESAWIMAVEGMERHSRGLLAWCRKESVIKAIGTGIVTPLTDIAFSPDGLLTNLPAAYGQIDDWRTHSGIIACQGEQAEAVFSAAWKIDRLHQVV